MWQVDGSIGGGQVVRTAVAIAALRGIKQALDPKGVFNAGKVV